MPRNESLAKLAREPIVCNGTRNISNDVNDMPIEVTIADIAGAMKKHGIPNYSKINKWNKDRYLTHLLRYLISTNKILPYMLSPIGMIRIMEDSPFKFKRFEELSDNQKKMVIHAFKAEKMKDSPNNYCYTFQKMYIHDVPASFWENVYNTFTTSTWYDTVLDALFKIYKLEQNITKRGYTMNRPVMLKFVEYFGGNKINNLKVIGGNHRLQAVRNLIAYDKLPKTFKLPVFIIREKHGLFECGD